MWTDLTDFFAEVPADFAFLVALPFLVVALAFVPDLWRRWRRAAPAPGSAGRVTATGRTARRA
jgi:hypothetical protein